MWSGSSWVPADYDFAVVVSGSAYTFSGYRIIISWILVNVTDVPKDESIIVRGYSLSQNYPNPFNPTTIISFSLPTKSVVSLKIYDILGRDVSTLVSEEMSTGNYTKQWDVSTLASGIYFYRLQAGSFVQTKKMLYLK